MLPMHRRRTPRRLDTPPVLLNSRIARLLRLALRLALIVHNYCHRRPRLRLDLAELLIIIVIGLGADGRGRGGCNRRLQFLVLLFVILRLLLLGRGRGLGDVFFGAGGGFVAFLAGLDALGDFVLEAESRLLAWAARGGRGPGGPAAGGGHCVGRDGMLGGVTSGDGSVTVGKVIGDGNSVGS